MNRATIFVLLLLAAFPVSAVTPEREATRVEVIAPSTPLLDDYSQTYVLARRGGAPVPDFRGEVWLWTDGPYIRPYHLNFTAADQGLIGVRIKFQGQPLQRVETYQLGSDSTISAWSNPVIPAAPGEPLLLWGALDNCDQPGLDFCLSASGGRPSLPALSAIGIVTARAGSDVYLIDPDREDAAALAAAIGGADARRLKELRRAGAIVRLPEAPAGELWGAWVMGASPAQVFAAFARGRVYRSDGGRILIKPLPGHRALVAGYGPREEVTVVAGETEKKYVTDNYYLTLPLPEGEFKVVVREEGRAAVATDRLLASF